MRSQKSQAIVLHSFPSRERDKLVVVLTPEFGKIRGWAYGARSIKSRYGSMLEPLAKIEISWMEKEGEETVRFESATLIRSMFDVQQKLRPSIALTYIGETADTFAQAGEAAQLMFRLIDRCCEGLLAGIDPLIVLAYFEVWVLRINGIFPSMQNCIECHEELPLPLRFDEGAAGFVCKTCSNRIEVIPNDIAGALHDMSRITLEDFAAREHRTEILFELRRLARLLRRHFLGHELKSFDVLQGVL
jgi:DNA repair protein RecO (recombination protein O)